MVKKTLLAAALLILLHPGGLWARAAGPEPQSGQQPGEAQLKVQQQELEAQKQALEGQKKVMEAQKLAMEEARKRILILEKRPRLGLILRTEADGKEDANGATVEAVTPGGPADEAGIKAGDVITKFNGQSLAGPYAGAEEDESPAAAKLVDLVGKLKEGEKVTLEYRRGSETKSATVSPRVLGPHAYAFHGDFEAPDVPDVPDIPDVEEMLRHVSEANQWSWIGDSPRWLDMEMVPLNPELGEYFGTSSGILVIEAPKDSALKVRGGDVILKIGDREPRNPSQVMRILRSYEPGETVSLQVLRKQKRETLSFKVPERTRERSWDEGGRHGHPEAAPAPPPPPSAPAAPPVPQAPPPRT